MNKQIEKLAKEAGIDIEAWRTYPGGFPREDYLVMKKFAELLIKETLQVARVGMEYGPSMEYAVYKYFGVEA